MDDLCKQAPQGFNGFEEISRCDIPWPAFGSDCLFAGGFGCL